MTFTHVSSLQHHSQTKKLTIMPPKISFVSGKKRKAKNDLTETTQPSTVPKPYVPPMFGTSKPYTPPVIAFAKSYTPPIFGSFPASSQDSAKRLRVDHTQAPPSNVVPNPFRRGNAAPATSHTPPKQRLFCMNDKKDQASAQPSGNDTNGAPNSSQTSTTSRSNSSWTFHTPPKVSLFSKSAKKQNVPQAESPNSSQGSSQNSNQTKSGPTLSPSQFFQTSSQNGNLKIGRAHV